VVITSSSSSSVEKTTICHIPPGNPDNAHTITVGGPAVRAHEAHGDYIEGSCEEKDPVKMKTLTQRIMNPKKNPEVQKVKIKNQRH
jgi:hypothetical protein